MNESIDFKMDNLTQNGTDCSGSLKTIHIVLNTILLFFSFPATFVVIVKLLRRIYEKRSFSSAEIFLLQINLANVSLFVFNLVLFLNVVQNYIFSYSLYFTLLSPTLTARPICLLTLCVIFYLAIARPVTYMTVKTFHHWEWLVITLAWLYALAINLGIIIYEINIFQLSYTLLFYNTILPSMFFNIATLRALSSSTPGNGAQSSNATKKKAFRIILSILVILLLYYVPRVLYFTYPYINPGDSQRFECYEGSVLMFLPKFSEVAMPVIFLYSLHKLGV